MSARKLLNVAVAIAPAVLMGGIGIHARTYEDPYEWTDSHADHERISSYIPIVRKTNELLASRKSAQENQARLLAREWQNGAKSGRLQLLVPISSREMVEVGMKAEIFSATVLVSRRLIEFADQDIAAGRIDEGVENLVLASNTLGVLKNSDFITLFRSCTLQSHVLKRLEPVAHLATERRRRDIARCVVAVRVDARTIEAMRKRTRKLIVMAALNQVDEGDPADAPLISPAASYLSEPAHAKTDVSASRFGDEMATRLDQMSVEMSLCQEADQSNRLTIDGIMSRLNRRKRT
jgi:hypothetical protein